MKRKRALPLLIGAIFVVAGLASPSQAQMEYQVNFLFGQKMLDENDWEPLEDHSEYGVSSTFGGEDWPVHIALDYIGSSDDSNLAGLKIEADTTELAAGVRKIWKMNKARPFLGGGLAVVDGEAEVAGFSVDDENLGLWVDGGVFWTLGRRFNIGIEARVSRAEIEILGVDVEAGGEHIGLILGFGKAAD